MTAPALMLASAALAGATAAPPGAPTRPVVAEKLPVPMSAMRVKGWAGERRRILRLRLRRKHRGHAQLLPRVASARGLERKGEALT